MAEYTHGRGYNLGMNAGREPEWEMPQQLAGDAVLSQAQVASFHQRRFIALDGVFPEELLAAHLAIHASHFPEPGPGLDATQVPTASIQFPFAADEMTANLVTLHPNVLTAVSQLLGTTDIRLTRSNLSQKYGVGVHQPGADASSGDQGMHKDTLGTRTMDVEDNSVSTGNNTIMVPPPDRPESIQCRLFLTHVEDAGAAFAVVPHPSTLLADDAEDTRTPAELYASERLVRYRPGTVVMYRADTWHRGTPAIEGALRRTHGFVYRRADCDWVQAGGQGMHADQTLKRLAPLWPVLSPWQRSCLGFPREDSSYWTTATIAAVGRRYPDVDLSPYAKASIDNDNGKAEATEGARL